jgi:hypothetical protein
MDIEMFGPLSDRSRRSVECQSTITASIIHLFKSCAPFHVSADISTRIINAINGMLRRRTATDFGKECWKRIAPFFTHRNTASAIVTIGFISLIVTACFDETPCVIFRTGIASGESMSGIHSYGSFDRQASARANRSGCQVSQSNIFALSTIALTTNLPDSGEWQIFNYPQATESAANDVFSHGSILPVKALDWLP